MLFSPKNWQSGPAFILPPFSFMPYHLPLAQPYAWAKGIQHSRKGIIVSCDLQGHLGYGEIAPPPQNDLISEEYFEAARAVLEDFDCATSDLISHLAQREICPRLRCGLVSAWLSAKADLQGLPLAALLAKMSLKTPAKHVPVNALITSDMPEDCAEKTLELCAKGFTVFKIKLFGQQESDLARVCAVRKMAPNARLRLDANGSWNTHQALSNLHEFARLNIDYIEDPLPADTKLEELRTFKQASPIKLAVDEAAASLSAIEKILQEQACDVLILKTQRLGGPDIALEAARLSEQHKIPCTLTASLESAVGLMVALQTASLLPQPINACGIGTADYFKHNLATFPDIHQGKLLVPLQMGPGI